MRHTDPQVGVLTPPPATDSTDITCKVNKLQTKAPVFHFVKTGGALIDGSDFGVEIGGARDFESLPRAIPGASDKLARKLCTACHQHRSLFRYRGRVRFDSAHDLCFRCYRSVIDRLSATLLAESGGENHAG
jgi:hypothetical protein